MIDLERQLIIRVISEIFAYEIYFHYINSDKLDNLDLIYNEVHTQFVHTEYKKEIMELGTLMARSIYEVPAPN